MDGILIIDKHAGITSHDVVAKVRRILKTKRVGHTGTLDPFATGVMVLLVGQATRLAQFLDKDEKEYEAVVRFGFETDTGDRTGERRDAETSERREPLTRAVLESVFPDFRGEIDQTPPMYSAKKVDGKKLYELARKGETVERKAVRVSINALELVPEQLGSVATADLQTAKVRVACSAGTYIRTLAEDIGRKLGTGAHLEELRRVRAGQFTIGQSISIDDLADLADPVTRLVPMERAILHLSAIELSDERVAKTKNGLSTRLGPVTYEDGQAIRMVDRHQDLVAVGFYNAAENLVQPKVVFGIN